jgi:hypothetical protein
LTISIFVVWWYVRKTCQSTLAQYSSNLSIDPVFTTGRTAALPSAIYSKGVKNVTAEYTPMDFHWGSQAALDRVVKFLSMHTKV